MAPGWLLSTLLPSLGPGELWFPRWPLASPWHTVSQSSAGFILPFRAKSASRLKSHWVINRDGQCTVSIKLFLGSHDRLNACGSRPTAGFSSSDPGAVGTQDMLQASLSTLPSPSLWLGCQQLCGNMLPERRPRLTRPAPSRLSSRP